MMVFMKKMNAIQILSYGGPELLSHSELSVSKPGQNEVLVHNAYSGINFIDIYMRNGVYANNRAYATSLPLTLGMEASGTVIAIGPGVKNVRCNERVAFCLSPGTYSEYSVVPAWKLVKLPNFVDFQTGATLMLQGSTAHYLSHSLFPLKKKHCCLIHAGAGGVGQLLIQLAKMLDAKVITTVGNEEKANIVRNLGADVIIPYKDVDFYEAVMEETGGLGVDVVYESVGKDTIEKSFSALKSRGTCVLFGFSSGAVISINPQVMADAGSIFVTRPNLADYMANATIISKRATDLFSYLKEEKLKVNINQIFSITKAAAAQKLLESGQSSGKLLLQINNEH